MVALWEQQTINRSIKTYVLKCRYGALDTEVRLVNKLTNLLLMLLDVDVFKQQLLF